MAWCEGDMEKNQSNQENRDQRGSEEERGVIAIACGKSW
jgi:hypothetical protein